MTESTPSVGQQQAFPQTRWSVVVAARLGLTDGTARVTVHRLRKRFREIFREEIAQTLAEDGDLNGELRHLARALGQKQEV